jgi:hypothetical protein
LFKRNNPFNKAEIQVATMKFIATDVTDTKERMIGKASAQLGKPGFAISIVLM